MLNMSRLAPILTGLVLALVIGGQAYVARQAELTPSEGINTNASGLTLAEVAKHSMRTSCWSTLNGSVYDLTSWIPNHPGGEEAILYLCGIDGTQAFNTQHGGDSKVAKILGGFKIGTLN